MPSKWWNVLAPVVAVISAETAGEAIGKFKAQLAEGGFDVYEDGEPACNAFESDVEDPPAGYRKSIAEPNPYW